MAQSLIRGSTQILSASVSWDRMVTGAIVPTASLIDGAKFLQSDGTVAMTATFDAGSHIIQNVSNGISAQDAVTVSQLHALQSGFQIHFVTIVSATNLTLSGVQSIDGSFGSTDMRVFLYGQTTPSENGIWITQSGAWTRPDDWPTATLLNDSQYIIVGPESSTVANTKWFCSTFGPFTVDTDSVTFVQDTSGTSYTNGVGLGLSGTTFSVLYGTSSTTAAAGNDSRITGALQTSALGTNVETALGIAIGSAGAPVLLGGAGGTPSAINLSNGSALPAATGLTGTLAAGYFPAFTGGDITSSAGSLALAVDHTAGSGFLKYTDFVTGEVLGGTPNGTLTAFTLAHAPQNDSQKIYLNGQRMNEGSGNDYTISGTSVTMLFSPQTGDLLIVDYQK